MEDQDLKFLRNCSNEDLQLLCDIITKDKDGDIRWTEELTITEVYKENYPNNMKELVDGIVDELQKFGGNTVRNILRGHGVSYREILIRVCKAKKVNFNKGNTVQQMEQYLLQNILITAVESMKEEDIKHVSQKLTKEALLNNLGVIKAGNPLFLKMTMIAVQQIAEKQGLKLAAGFLGKFAGSKVYTWFTGPIGWAVSIAWSAYDIAGPAYRVIFPAVVTVAYLRMKSALSDEELNEMFS